MSSSGNVSVVRKSDSVSRVLSIVLLVSLVAFCGYLAFVSFRGNWISTASNDSELIKQLNDFDEEMFQSFNHHLKEWIQQSETTGRWYRRRRTLQTKAWELGEKLKAHRALIAKLSKKEDSDKFRSEKAKKDIQIALQSNASSEETWKRAEIYLKTMSYQRVDRLEAFLITFLGYPYSNSSLVFKSTLVYNDVEIEHLVQKDLPKNLTSRARQFLTDFKQSTIPGMLPHCLVYESNSTTLDATATLDKFVDSIGHFDETCFPDGELSQLDKKWTFRDYAEVIVIYLVFVLVFAVAILES